MQFVKVQVGCLFQVLCRSLSVSFAGPFQVLLRSFSEKGPKSTRKPCPSFVFFWNSLFFLGGRFGYFVFFLLGGGIAGKGEFEAPGRRGGGHFFFRVPGEGVGGGRVAGRVSAGNFWGGGGAKYFLSGPKFPPRVAPS